MLWEQRVIAIVKPREQQAVGLMKQIFCNLVPKLAAIHKLKLTSKRQVFKKDK